MSLRRIWLLRTLFITCTSIQCSSVLLDWNKKICLTISPCPCWNSHHWVVTGQGQSPSGECKRSSLSIFYTVPQCHHKVKPSSQMWYTMAHLMHPQWRKLIANVSKLNRALFTWSGIFLETSYWPTSGNSNRPSHYTSSQYSMVAWTSTVYSEHLLWSPLIPTNHLKN